MIAFFIRNLRIGGAERVAVNLLKGMSERGVGVELVLCSKDGAFLEDVPSQVPIHDLGCGSVYKAVRPLGAYLRDRRPRLLVSHASSNNGAVVLANLLSGRASKVALVEHGGLRLLTEGQPHWKRAVLAQARKLLYPRADQIVAVSRGLARELESELGLPANSVKSIYNPVIDAALLARAAPAPGHPWFGAGEPPVILSVGRLIPRKDHATLIRAFAQVRQRRSSRLLILGEGPHRPELEALVRQLGLGEDVGLPGAVDNPFPYLSRAGVFVLSSWREALPTALVEAMACGTPVVSTACPFGPDEILEEGKYGALVPVGDPEPMAEAILAALGGPRNAERLRERAQAFSFDQAVSEYLRL